MNRQAQPAERARIGAFEVNFLLGELRKNGIRLKIHDQPLEILAMLVSRPSELVTREDIRQRLWPSGTFVDFDNGLNSAINRLRGVLGDSAEAPKFIETIPRRGYRLIAPVEWLDAPAVTPVAEQPGSVGGLVGPRRLLHQRWLWTGALAIAIAAVSGFLAVRYFASQEKSALNFQPRDWVLITNFENRTGEAVFNGTLEYALERELSNSQFVNVVPRERMNDALGLMRRPLDSTIDAELGREICLRDGDIRALLTGRVEKLGTTYVLTANLVDPARGTTVASISEEDPEDSQMAAAVRRLSDRVRETLGEERSLIQQNDQRLERVTTPSLHALQLYTQADNAMRVGSVEVAAEMLERAIQEDPKFASAWLLLGFAYADAGDEPKSAPYFKRAFELADTVTDRERFFILGSYYEAAGHNPQKAVESYETLLRLYPDHFWGIHSLAGWYIGTGRMEEFARLAVRKADLAPSDLVVNATAVWAKAILDKDWKGAQKYRDHANALLAQQGDRTRPGIATWIKLLPVYQSWIEGNVEQAHAQLIQLEVSGNLGRRQTGYAHLGFGELRRAEECFQAVSNRDAFVLAEGDLLFIRGDWFAVKKFLPSERYLADNPGDPVLIFMVRAGMWSDVERAMQRARQEWGPLDASGIEITEGELALAKGDDEHGISLLEDGLGSRGSVPRPSPTFFLASDSLAGAYEKQGRLDQALRVLQRASSEKSRTLTDPHWGPGNVVAMWMTSELHLADLYRKMGRVSDAEKIEGELSRLLIYADPDHPILRALQSRQHSDRGAGSK